MTTSRRTSLKTEKLKTDGSEESLDDVKEDAKKVVPTVIVSLPETLENVTVERGQDIDVTYPLLHLQDNIRKFEDNVEAQVCSDSKLVNLIGQLF